MTGKNEDLKFYSNSDDVDNDKDDCIVTDFNHDGKSDLILIDAYYSYHNNIFTGHGESMKKQG